MKEWHGSEDLVVADVDCTTEGGKPKCVDIGIRSFPTVKYGKPDDLQEYTGARDYYALANFARTLGTAPTTTTTTTTTTRRTTTTTTTTQCFLATLHLCDSAKTEMVEEYMQYEPIQRESLIKAKEGRKQKVEAEGKEFREDQALRLLKEVHLKQSGSPTASEEL